MFISISQTLRSSDAELKPPASEVICPHTAAFNQGPDLFSAQDAQLMLNEKTLYRSGLVLILQHSINVQIYSSAQAAQLVLNEKPLYRSGLVHMLRFQKSRGLFSNLNCPTYDE